MAPGMVAMQVSPMQASKASNNLVFGLGSFPAAVSSTPAKPYTAHRSVMLCGALGFYVQMTTTMLIGFLSVETAGYSASRDSCHG